MSASLMLLGAIAATSSAPTQAPLPHLKRRRRSHEPSSLSVVNIVPTGTPRERRQRIFKEWLASGHSPGKGTAGFFAQKINAYVATHPDAADGDLHFERGSMGNFLAAADKTRVSRHKVGAKAPATWTISTPQAYKRNLVVVDRRTLARLQGDRATLRECLRLHPGLAAAGTASSSSSVLAAAGTTARARWPSR